MKLLPIFRKGQSLNWDTEIYPNLNRLVSISTADISLWKGSQFTDTKEGLLVSVNVDDPTVGGDVRDAAVLLFGICDRSDDAFMARHLSQVPLCLCDDDFSIGSLYRIGKLNCVRSGGTIDITVLAHPYVTRNASPEDIKLLEEKILPLAYARKLVMDEAPKHPVLACNLSDMGDGTAGALDLSLALLSEKFVTRLTEDAPYPPEELHDFPLMAIDKYGDILPTRWIGGSWWFDLRCIDNNNGDPKHYDVGAPIVAYINPLLPELLLRTATRK